LSTSVSFFSKAVLGTLSSEYPNINPSASSRPNSIFEPAETPEKSKGVASLLTS